MMEEPDLAGKAGVKVVMSRLRPNTRGYPANRPAGRYRLISSQSADDVGKGFQQFSTSARRNPKKGYTGAAMDWPPRRAAMTIGNSEQFRHALGGGKARVATLSPGVRPYVRPRKGPIMVNGALPPRKCVNPGWLIFARRIYFRSEFHL